MKRSQPADDLEGSTPTDSALLKDLQEQNSALQAQLKEAKKRESELVIRLTQKQNDANNLDSQLKITRSHITQRRLHIRASYMDPLINDNFKTLKEEIAGYEKQLQETKENLDAVKFDQVSPQGQKLIAKCRRLHNENKALAKEIEESDPVKLRTELELCKKSLEDLTAESAENVQLLEATTEHYESEMKELQNQVFSLKRQVANLKNSSS